MDGWKLDELRAAVICDLKAHIPAGFYAAGQQKGVTDYKLGKLLYYGNADNPVLTPRELLAAEVLMHLGLLFATKHAAATDIRIGHAEHWKRSIPTFESNLRGALSSYVLRLPPSEAGPLTALLESQPQAEQQPAPAAEAASLTQTAAPAEAAAPVVAAKPLAIPRQRAQESRIIELLKAQGYDPLNLAQRAPGRPGPKAEIRTLALSEKALFSDRSFEKAWERLRSYGELAGAE